jgi:DNA helicase-2/ATP-dependent DNA helicase PcrA
MSLNPRQQQAVEHPDGPLLLLAAAGSGKTRVLVHRIARLLERDRVRPFEILAVTFTNKAARELVERCASLVGPQAGDLWAGTFHGIGARILRRHAEILDFPQAFSIYDSDDQLRLIKELVAEANLDETLFAPDSVRAYIETAKNDGHGPDASELPRYDAFSEKSAEIYERYQKRLRQLGAMDFGDLILGVLQLFKRDAALLARYRDRFRHVLVDEYQDTNRAQYLMVKTLAAGHGNICVVGDDDQSIYGWRGADLRNILEFERDFPGAEIVHLDQNYRSTSNIIDAAQAVIANNRERMGKKMWTDNDAGEKIRMYTASDERDEARYIVDRIRTLGKDRGAAAVFYRTNAQSRAIEEELIRSSIPYTIVGTTRFYERREVKDLLAYLRFIANPNDDLSLARIINVPARGIGRVSFEALRAGADREGVSLWRALGSDEVANALKPAARKKFAAFHECAVRWVDDSGTRHVTPLLEQVIADTGYLDFLAGLAGEDPRSRIENVQELLTVSQNFDAEPPAANADDEDPELEPLAGFLEQIALASAVDGYDERESSVTLMTIHNSKGLEFPYVFIAGMEEGIFPHARSTDESERGIEEERRLCYVGITRARKELTMLRAVKRHLYGATQFNFASRFLDEVPTELLAREYAEERQEGSANVLEASWQPEAPAPIVDTGKQGTFRVGMKVAHPMFGVGTVRKCDTSGSDEKVVVNFQRVGMKKLVARYARLEIV